MKFFFGLRSPYAWLACRLVEDFVPAAERARISHLPFWEPEPHTLAALRATGADFLYRPMSRERHLYILQDIKRLAAHFGYALRWPIDGAGARWELPHLAFLRAEQHGLGYACMRAIFAARWEQGRAICEMPTLQGVAREIGLPADAFDGLEQDAALHAAAVQALRTTVSNGAFGVPFFVVGRERFWGVDRLAFALSQAGLSAAALNTAWNARPAAPRQPAAAQAMEAAA